MLHTFVALVEDKPGLLTRVTSLFRRLNVNIISLTVGGSERVGVSRTTIVCRGVEDRRAPHHGVALQTGKRARGRRCGTAVRTSCASWR